jgi:hypothetical protein
MAVLKSEFMLLAPGPERGVTVTNVNLRSSTHRGLFVRTHIMGLSVQHRTLAPS